MVVVFFKHEIRNLKSLYYKLFPHDVCLNNRSQKSVIALKKREKKKKKPLSI